MTTNTATAVVESLADDVRQALGLAPGESLDVPFAALGGSSLDAAQVTVRMRRTHGLALGAHELLNAASVRRLLDDVAARPRTDPADRAADPAPADRAPLTWQQRVIWYQSLLDPDSSRYVFHALFHFAEAPRPAALRVRLGRLLHRHPVLRTRLLFDDGEPWQAVPAADVTDAEIDLSVVDLPEPTASPEELVRLSGADRAFDLRTGPLLRWVLVRLPDGRAVLVHTEHHLIHDGKSFVALLGSLDDDTAEPDPDPRYFAYAAAQTPADPGEVREVAERAAQAAGRILDAGTPASGRDTFLRLPVPPALLREVREGARRASVSLFTALFTAFSQALTQYEGVGAAVLGSAVENRPPGHEDTVGMFVSTVPVVVERRPGELPEATLRRTRGALREAMDRSAVPLSDVVQAVGGTDGRGDSAVVRAAFSMHQQVEREVELAGATARVQLGVFNGAAKFPVNVVAVTSGTGDDTRVELLMEAQDGAVGQDDLWALWTGTLEWLRTWVQLLPEPRTAPATALVAKVTARAAAEPEAVALDDGARQVTYGRLAAWGEAARRLPTRPGGVVGILGTATPDFFACAYAVLHAGGTYVPLEAGQPAERLASMVAQARCTTVVRLPGVPDDLAAALDGPDGAPRLLDWTGLAAEWDAGPAAAPETAPDGDSAAPAYIMFTSGSTGEPKGVMVPRAALDRLAAWAVRELRLGPDTVVGQLANAAFDASAFEVWSGLYAGARIRFAPTGLRADPQRLAGWFAEAGVEYAFVATPIAELLARVPKPAGSRLDRISTGGDRLHALPEDVPFEVLNMYGPTETTVVATAGWVDPGGAALPPIGRPLPYGYARVVTADGALAVPGEQGELWVGGDGVATGYAGAPRQTAARFVADPYAEDGAVVYRTGDVVHLDSGGRLHYSGRRDRQFKLAGVRFELGEIEAVALRRPGVEQAVALTVGSPAGSRLHLFVSLAAGTPADATDEAVRAALPAQLRHLTIHHPDTLPYNSSGKVDQRRLTELAERGRPTAGAVPERTVSERTVSEPAVFDSALSERTVPEPAVFEPAASALTVPEPAVFDSAVSEWTAPERTVSEPAVAAPAVFEPAGRTVPASGATGPASGATVAAALAVAAPVPTAAVPTAPPSTAPVSAMTADSAGAEPVGGGSAALETLWPALVPLSRRERLDLAHRLIGSVLGGTAAGEETR
ncbi:AMP-binding protein [Streptomyces sp. NPDC007157]|uniref:AMP-binding protein n=1 Tax=Streptomyces sp. NPDC007157 TaxID=3154681 RepID=UPI0033DDA286